MDRIFVTRKTPAREALMSAYWAVKRSHRDWYVIGKLGKELE
jgi:hypothetical protein